MDLRNLVTGLVRKARFDVPEASWVPSTVSYTDAVIQRRSRRYSAAELFARTQGTIDYCVRLVSTQCSGSPLRLYAPANSAATRAYRTRSLSLRQQRAAHAPRMGKASIYADNAGDVVEVTDHPSLSLLNRPSAYYDGVSYSMLKWTHRFIGGTAWELVETERPNGRGEPVAILPLFPAYVTPQPSKERLLDGVWYYREQSTDAWYDASRLNRYWLMPDYSNPYIGRSPLRGIEDEADAASAIIDEVLARMQNMARPDMAWVSEEPLAPTQQREFEQRLEKFRGPRNAGRPIVTSQMKPMPLQMTYKDMEWKELNAVLERRIRNAFNLPESFADLNDANRASSVAGNRQFYALAIDPALRTDAEQLTVSFLSRFGVEEGEMWFGYDNPDSEDEERTSRVLVSYVGAKILTRNEARAEIGYEPVDGGDEFEQAMQGFDITRTPTRNPDADAETPDEPDDESEDDAGEPVGKARPAAAPPIVVKKLGWHFSGHDHKGLGSEDAIKRTPEYTQIMQVMSDFYAEEYPWLADEIAAGRGAAARYDMEKRLRTVLEPIMDSLFRRGLAAVVAESGAVPNPLLTDNALAALDNYTIRLTDEITRTMESEIKDAIAQGLAQGMNGQSVAREIQAQIGDSVTWRAERVARSETARAQEYGRLTGLQDAGVDRKRWLLSNAPCQFCEAAQRMVNTEFPEGVPLNQPFLKLGTVVTGTAGGTMVVSYMDVQAPTDLHPQCACSVTGVWKV